MDPQKHIAELQAALVAKDETIDELRGEVAELTAALAIKDEAIDSLREQVAELTALVAELKENLGQNSRNSHKPPSSDGPGQRKTPKKRRNTSGRKRGGQKGHKGHQRELVAPEKVDEFVHHYPAGCEQCCAPLPTTPDDHPTRHQVIEVPPMEPKVVEHQLHAVHCECGHTTRATDSYVPASVFGPRLMALVAMLTGVYHLSRRKAARLLSEFVGVSMSLGSISNVEARVSEAIKPAVEQAWDHVDASAVKHTDATSWLSTGTLQSLWTLASKGATVFKIFANGKIDTIQTFFGTLKGILISDRATVFGFWAMKKRQICWSHLIRKFVAFSERDGPARDIGEQLLDYAGIMFSYWHDYRDQKLDKAIFLRRMAPLRQQVEDALLRAADANIGGVSGACSDILGHKAALWTFIDRDDVEPTNNHAELELRNFVLWRKRSFGAQSERGNLFAERIMTVAHTARKQQVDVLEFVTDCCRAYATDNLTTPSLFDRTHETAAAHTATPAAV